ncbi:MAG: ABC transporter ATP-binding protein [Anaerofustis sp.]
MIQIKNLTKNFKKKRALDHVSVDFNNGIYGLLGPNGAGKTTLMRTMLGLYKVQEGEVIYNNENIKNNDAYLKDIGYLPQKFGLFKELTVYEMMEYIATLKRIKPNLQKEEIESCISQVNLTEHRNDKVGALSGGMLRRLGIAQALLGDTKVIIVDEPTAGLDPEERVRFKNLLSEIKQNRIVILSTHIVEDIEAICDQIIIMNEGKIIASGDSNSIRNFASNKVFHVPIIKEQNLCGNYFIEKRYYADNQEMLRVLSLEQQPGMLVNPSIEDGYMCLVKGFIS